MEAGALHAGPGGLNLTDFCNGTNMINRELIRLKVVQQVYVYYMNCDRKLDTAEKDLFASLSKSYDLYLYMFGLMLELNRIAERSYATALSRHQRLKEGDAPSTRFIDNKFIAQLESNEQLRDFIDNQKKTWANEEDYVRRLFQRITESDIYAEWMSRTEPTTYDDDRNLWRQLYQKVIAEDEELDTILEEESLYWNDDRFIVDTFVLKTIKRFEPIAGAHHPLLPEYRDDDDREFARRLLRATVLGCDTYRQLIQQSLRNWDLERLAFMDLLVMQTALAEIVTFPQIPVSVSINEYVEIAKMYSTPKSGGYVNGMLDSICRRMIDEGRLRKEMTSAAQ